MASKVGGVYVDLDLRIAKMEANLAKAQRQTRQATSRMEKNFAGAQAAAARFGKAVLALGSVAAFGAAVKGALNFADATVKMADKTGVAAESLQAFRHAADLTGVSADEMDKAFLNLNKRIGEFQQTGTGSAKNALDALGLSSDVLTGRIGGTEQAFFKIADALQKLPNDAQRAAAAAGLFGDKIGPKLLILLNQGTGGIEAMMQEARDLGIVMDTQLGRDAEKANDAMSKLWRVVKMGAFTLFAELAPAITAAADGMVELIKKTRTAIAGLKEFFGPAAGVDDLAQKQAGALAHADRLEAEAAAMQAGIERQVDLIREGRKALAALEASAATDGRRSTQARIDDRRDELAALEADALAMLATQRKLNQTVAEIRSGFAMADIGMSGPGFTPPAKPKPGDTPLTPKGDGKKTPFQEAVDGAEKQIEAFRRLANEAGVTGTQLIVMRTMTEAYAKATEKGAELTDKQRNALERLHAELMEAARAADTAAKAQERADAIKDTTAALEDRINAIRDETAAIGLSTAAAERYNAALQMRDALLKAGVTSLSDEEIARQEKLLDILEQEAAKRDELRKKEEERQRQEEAFQRQMESAWSATTDVIAGLISKTATWRDALRVVLSEVLKIAAELARVELGVGGKSSKSGSGLSGIFDALGSVFGGVLDNPPVLSASSSSAALTGFGRFHDGGTVGGSSPFRLKSDEVPAVLQRGEVVVPKNMAGALRGDGQSVAPSAPASNVITINQNVTIDARGQGNDMEARLRRAMLQTREEAVRDMARAVNQGGSMAKIMGRR